MINSVSVLGYFLQFSGRSEYARQKLLPSDSNFRKGHTFGSLQHWPQPIHEPFLFAETGSTEVNVRIIFAPIVFFIFKIAAFEALCPVLLYYNVSRRKDNAIFCPFVIRDGRLYSEVKVAVTFHLAEF